MPPVILRPNGPKDLNKDPSLTLRMTEERHTGRSLRYEQMKSAALAGGTYKLENYQESIWLNSSM